MQENKIVKLGCEISKIIYKLVMLKIRKREKENSSQNWMIVKRQPTRFGVNTEKKYHESRIHIVICTFYQIFTIRSDQISGVTKCIGSTQCHTK